jgi:hypothetical protein
MCAFRPSRSLLPFRAIASADAHAPTARRTQARGLATLTPLFFIGTLCVFVSYLMESLAEAEPTEASQAQASSSDELRRLDGTDGAVGGDDVEDSNAEALSLARSPR